MTTIVFPGQGSQYLGMAEDFYNKYQEAKEVFNIVESATNMPIKEIIFNDPNKVLNLTKYTQLCIFSVSMAIYRVFCKEFKNTHFLDINTMLGHSLGEYSALVASNVMKIEDCASILKIRGELMQESYPENQSGMAAVLGLDCNDLEAIFMKHSLNLDIANDNAPGQVVISGIINEINSAEKILIENGAKKIIKLNVSAAFHSRIMNLAQEKLKNELSNINFYDSEISIISNYTANFSKNSDIIFHNLVNQMANKVRWNESIKLLEKNNEKNIIEIGPGKVLTGLIKRISSKFHVYNLNKVSDLDIIKNAI